MTGSKHHYKTDQSIEKFFGLPLKIPISLSDLDLGNIKIDFEQNKEKSTIKKRRLILSLVAELAQMGDLLKKDIDLTLRAEERTLYQPRIFFGFIVQGYLPLEQSSEILDYFFYKDDEIFELIKSEGPISFLNSVTQRKMNKWISDKNIAGNKINKLKDSLMEYTFGSSFKDKLLKVGRPEIDILRKFGTKWIKDFYKDLSSILKHAKMVGKSKQIDKISELIEQAYVSFIHSLKVILEKEPDSKEVQRKLKAYELHLKLIYTDEKFTSSISECIENDEDLKSEFCKYKWEPNKLAKKVIAKLLEVSPSKIEEILYRQKQ